MNARRLGGLLAAVLMLHLTFVGADWTCAQHGTRAATHHMGAGSQGHKVTQAPEQPCETPTQPDCCRAMTSCAVNVAFTAGPSLGGIPGSPAIIAAHVSDAPPSPDTSPDPPPPKA